MGGGGKLEVDDWEWIGGGRELEVEDWVSSIGGGGESPFEVLRARRRGRGDIAVFAWFAPLSYAAKSGARSSHIAVDARHKISGILMPSRPIVIPI